MSEDDLRRQIETLTRRLEEADDTIRAIQTGSVDGFVMQSGGEQRLYTLEGADRPYRILVEEMQQGAATLQANGTIVFCNQQMAKLLAVSHFQLIGRSLRDFIGSESGPIYDEMLTNVMSTTAVKDELSLVRADGERVSVYLTLNKLPKECGADIGVLVTDLTSQRHGEHLKLLVDELNHRVKNTLASVQSIAQQTLRKTSSPAQFAESFNGRIQALSRVHTMLSQTTWQGADLRTLVRDQVLLGPMDEARLTVRGPAVQLQPQLSLHLAMVIHELGTNSCKYGALSSLSGFVAVNWAVEDGILDLSWVERGGPPVSAPTKSGFGTSFIEKGIKAHGGLAKMLVEADGVSWAINIPIQKTEVLNRAAVKQQASSSPSDIHPRPASTSFRGKRILIVEDEPLVAMDIESILIEAETLPFGPATTVAQALKLIEDKTFDAAFVDGNLNGASVDDVAAALTRRGVPFAFVSGYGQESLPASFRHTPLVSKPFSQNQLVEMLGKLLVNCASSISKLHLRP